MGKTHPRSSPTPGAKFPKRILRPPRRCIFCGGGPISREHVFAAWMRPYLPAGDTSQQLRDGEIIQGKYLHQPYRPGPQRGDLRSRKLKVVCVPCNNEWMSRLQNASKPILIPFITGKEWPRLTWHSQRLLASWIAMFAMVGENSYPETTLITKNDRAQFKQDDSHSAPRNSIICIGSGDSQSELLGIRRRCVAPKKPETGEKAAYDSHIIVFSANKLIVQWFYTPKDALFSLARPEVLRLAAELGLRHIWPITELNQAPNAPSRLVSFDSVAPHIDRMTETLLLPNFRRYGLAI